MDPKSNEPEFRTDLTRRFENEAAAEAQKVAFHKKAVFEGDVESAFRLYGGAPHRQHNSLIGDGMEGLRKFVALLIADHPDAHGEIKRVFADGDYVILHSQCTACRAVRAAKPSSTFTGRKTARSSSTGMSSRRSRRQLRTTTRCSDPLTTAATRIRKDVGHGFACLRRE
jgi:predicted SnoaL-like aldol condensation-catalyzing enzyme